MRTWSTTEGLAAKGNSPGAELPKQWRWDRWKFWGKGGARERGGSSTMLRKGMEGEAPLVVASIGHCSVVSSTP